MLMSSVGGTRWGESSGKRVKDRQFEGLRGRRVLGMVFMYYR